MLSCPRESFVWVQGWHRGMRDRLVVACGRGGAPQPAVEELVDALENGVMTTASFSVPRTLHRQSPSAEGAVPHLLHKLRGVMV